MGVSAVAIRETSQRAERALARFTQKALDALVPRTYSKYTFEIPLHRRDGSPLRNHQVAHMIARRGLGGTVTEEVMAYSHTGQLYPLQRETTGRLKNALYAATAFVQGERHIPRHERHAYTDDDALNARPVIAKTLGMDPANITIVKHI